MPTNINSLIDEKKVCSGYALMKSVIMLIMFLGRGRRDRLDRSTVRAPGAGEGRYR